MTMVNYMTPSQAQLLGGQMMPSPDTPAQPVTNSPAMGGVPQMSPQNMQQLSGMGQQPQFPSNYTDNAGVSGTALNQAGIAPGYGGDGMLGLGSSYMFGGGGNSGNLSSSFGTNPSDQDLATLAAQFAQAQNG